MTTNQSRLLLVASIAAWVSTGSAASPCDGVDRALSNEQRVALALAIAKQLNVPRVDVLQSYRVDGWSIIYVDTHQSDETFLFYAQNPLTSRFLSMWGGAATRDEEQSIRVWAERNVRGIPATLANCFAWHVTKDRDL